MRRCICQAFLTCLRKKLFSTFFVHYRNMYWIQNCDWINDLFHGDIRWSIQRPFCFYAVDYFYGDEKGPISRSSLLSCACVLRRGPLKSWYNLLLCLTDKWLVSALPSAIFIFLSYSYILPRLSKSFRLINTPIYVPNDSSTSGIAPPCLLVILRVTKLQKLNDVHKENFAADLRRSLKYPPQENHICFKRRTCRLLGRFTTVFYRIYVLYTWPN